MANELFEDIKANGKVNSAESLIPLADLMLKVLGLSKKDFMYEFSSFSVVKINLWVNSEEEYFGAIDSLGLVSGIRGSTYQTFTGVFDEKKIEVTIFLPDSMIEEQKPKTPKEIREQRIREKCRTEVIKICDELTLEEKRATRKKLRKMLEDCY